MYGGNEIKGLFLLILAIGGGYTAETLGCKTQKLLSNNMYVKHMISLFILFFSISIFDTGEVKHPFDIFKSALGIYLLFICFTKMDIRFTAIVFLLMAGNYVLNLYINYLRENQPEEIPQQVLLEKIKVNIYKLIILLIVIGFVMYFKKQYTEHSKNWSTKKFLFGVRKCDSM
jgi:hypothetical protein